MVIISHDTENVRLKSYDATIKGTTTTLRITLEVTDTFELHYILRQLEELKTVQSKPKSKPRPAADAGRKKIGHQPLLALPPPSYDDLEDA